MALKVLFHGKEVQVLVERGPFLSKIVDQNQREYWVKNTDLIEIRSTERSLATPQKRLSIKVEKVKFVMMDGKWKTIKQINEESGYGTENELSGLTAAIRSLRKPEFGGYLIEKRYVNTGMYEYRMAIDY